MEVVANTIVHGNHVAGVVILVFVCNIVVIGAIVIVSGGDGVDIFVRGGNIFVAHVIIVMIAIGVVVFAFVFLLLFMFLSLPLLLSSLLFLLMLPLFLPM